VVGVTARRAASSPQWTELTQLVTTAALTRALTHPSYAVEHPDVGGNNQRLEYLGDAVVDLAVGDWLYHEHPDWPEGELTKARAALVCEASLAAAARRLGIGDALFLGHGEEATGGRERPSNLADAFEAIIGAVFLAGDYPAAANFVRRSLSDVVPAARERRDWKTALQEVARQHGQGEPVYTLEETTGPPHDRRFAVRVRCGDWQAEGGGRTKKAAEQEAARKVVQELEK
jgi:ribonuclease-3